MGSGDRADTGRSRKKPRPDADEKTQIERFKEAARKLGVDESEEAFERAFDKIVPPKHPTHAVAKKTQS